MIGFAAIFTHIAKDPGYNIITCNMEKGYGKKKYL